MAKGASPLSGKTSAKATNPQMQNVMNLLKSGQTVAAGDAINNDIEVAGYLLYDDGKGNVSIYGKNYNNGFSDIAPGARRLDADGMADVVSNNMNGGTWDLHKYDGQIQFPASSLKGSRGGVGFLNAIQIKEKPSNVTLNKVTETPDGKHTVYEVKGANPNAMFRFVAIEN